MRRSVSCQLKAELAASSDVVIGVAVAAGASVSESLTITRNGSELHADELVAEHGTRLHLLRELAPGTLSVTYNAVVTGRSEPPPVDEVDVLRYLRPSRYCESDRLASFARSEFHDLQGRTLLDAVSSWVGMRVAYVAGSSRPIDGAIATLLAREGVCRDFAHLVIAFLRACDTPARMVAVYAPGLQPMDFHAVVEAYVDGQWLVVDATLLAPRTGLVRIATGRDAADTAFLTSTGVDLTLLELEVGAVTEDALPDDDITRTVALG